eukprot:scaffold424_cov69-Phaeocystis_antarctica.AAC.2
MDGWPQEVDSMPFPVRAARGVVQKNSLAINTDDRVARSELGPLQESARRVRRSPSLAKLSEQRWHHRLCSSPGGRHPL